MIPRLSPCSSSPPPGATSTRKRSTIAATLTSDWPTPTVSTSTTSKPAASHSSSTSRVLRATPPSVPPVGDGRTNASGERVSSSMRVLSPRIEPPLRVLDGSTASTATRWPWSTTCRPNASMKVDFPAPGAPEMPMRIEPPVCGRTSARIASASARWSARVDSASVIARASDRRSPATTPSASSLTIAKSAVPTSEPASLRRHGDGRPTPVRGLAGSVGVGGRPRRADAARSDAFAFEEVEDLGGRGGDVRAGAEHRGDAGGVQVVVVLGRDHAAHDDEQVVGALLAQLRDQLGHERLVPGGLARHADHVHVVLDGVTRRLLGRLEQRADV